MIITLDFVAVTPKGRGAAASTSRTPLRKNTESPHLLRASEGQLRKVPITSSVPATLDQSGKTKSTFTSVENVSRAPSATVRKGNYKPLVKSKGPTSISQDLHVSESPARLSTPTKSQLTRNSDVMGNKISTPEIYSAVRFETPRKNGVEQQLGPGVEKSNLVVAVRVRPRHKQEEADQDMNQAVLVKDNEVNIVTDYGQTHTFSYDHCFSSCHPDHKQFGDQEKVYDRLARPLLSSAFKGI